MASTLAKLKRCLQTPMPIPWGDHLDLARCVALIGEEDLAEATTMLGRCLFHLQRDLLLETWEESINCIGGICSQGRVSKLETPSANVSRNDPFGDTPGRPLDSKTQS